MTHRVATEEAPGEKPFEYVPADAFLPATPEPGISDDDIRRAQAVQDAIGSVLRGRDRSAQPRKHLPRARISGYATVSCTQGEGEFETHSVDPAMGSLIFTEGSSQVATNAVAGTFLKAMRLGQVDRGRHDKARAKLGRVFKRTAPAVVYNAQSKLDEEDSDPDTCSIAAQIVDGKLVYGVYETGGIMQPMFVYSRRTGQCLRLTEDGGIHDLPSGRNVILMGNSPSANHNLPDLETVGDDISAALSEADPAAGDATTGAPLEPSDPREVANHIAARLQETLYGKDRYGTLLTAVVDVEPWTDRRGKWNRRADMLRGPSWLATRLLVRFTSRFENQEPQELYETNSGAGRRGRIAARLANAAFDGTLLAGAYMGVRAVLAATHLAHLPSISQMASELVHHRTGNTTGRSGLQPVAAENPSKAGTAPTAPAPEAKPPVSPPAAAAGAKSSFPDTYTALWSDPANHGHASNATNITLQSFHAEADAAGLSADDTTKLKTALDKDYAAINKGIDAFDHDTRDPDNIAVAHHPLKYVIDQTTYSTVDLKAFAGQEVPVKIQQLGLHVQPQPQLIPPTSQPPIAAHPPAVMLPITPGQRQTFHWPQLRPEAYILGAGGAAMLGAAALAVRKRRKKKWYKTDVSAIPDDKSRRNRRQVGAHRIPHSLGWQSSGRFQEAPFTIDDFLNRRGEQPLAPDSGARNRFRNLRVIAAANRQIRSYGSDD